MGDRTKSLSLPLAATVAICFVATAWWIIATSNKDDGQEVEAGKDERFVKLLPIEKTLAGGGGGDNAMSTLTWFQGEYKSALRVLRPRAREIFDANPWLAGRIRRIKGQHTLTYYSAPSETSFEEYFHVHDKAPMITRNYPLEELGSKLEHTLLKTGPKEPLFKISVHPSASNRYKYYDEKSKDGDGEYFAVVVSMSHVIGDGATFYKIQNMLLNRHETVEPLILKRIESSPEQQIQAMGGKDEYGILSTAGFIANCIKGALTAAMNKTKYAARSQIYLVDTVGMEQAKQEAISSLSQQNEDSSMTVKFVSSNDVLTSWFFQNCSCQHGMMAINFRGRLEGHSGQHAGNYENVIFYYQKEDSVSPALIRKSIMVGEKKGLYQRHVTKCQPLPSFMEMLLGSNAICTNWASFAKPCNLFDKCVEEVQIPLYNMASLLPSTMSTCCIFLAGPHGLAVLVAGSPDKLEGLEKAVPFLKKNHNVR